MTWRREPVEWSSDFRAWPISEVTTPLIEVRLVGRSGLDLLTHFDPDVWSGRA